MFKHDIDLKKHIDHDRNIIAVCFAFAVILFSLLTILKIAGNREELYTQTQSEAKNYERVRDPYEIVDESEYIAEEVNLDEFKSDLNNLRYEIENAYSSTVIFEDSLEEDSFRF